MNYLAISNTNQGSFNNPRHKTWATMQLGATGWAFAYIGNDYEEAKKTAGNLLKKGGMFMNINRVMVVEICPIDFTMTPSV